MFGALIGGIFSLLGIFILFPLILHIAITVWVYQDAQRRRDEAAILWAALVVFVPVGGIIIYLLVRSFSSVTPTSVFVSQRFDCPHCGGVVDNRMRFCPHCSANLYPNL